MMFSRKIMNTAVIVIVVISVIEDSFAVCPDCNCITKRRFLELMNLIPTQVCNPVQPSIITATPKKAITLNSPISVLANGNDVYVADSTSDSPFVFKYDQNGNLKESISIPKKTFFLEIKNNNLYAVARKDSTTTIYVKSIANMTDPFREFLQLPQNSNYMRFTPSGDQILIGKNLMNSIVVYNLDFTVNTTIMLPSGKARDIHFDAECNLYISNLVSQIYVYNQEYDLIRTINYPGTELLDGWLFQCDGGKILADREGKVVFVDKDDTVQQIFTNGYNSLRDVALTESGSLFLTDIRANKLLVYY